MSEPNTYSDMVLLYVGIITGIAILFIAAYQMKHTYAEHLNRKALQYQQQGDDERALSSAAKAVKISPRALTYYNLAWILFYRFSQPIEAMDCVNKAIGLYATWSLPYRLRAVIFEQGFHRSDLAEKDRETARNFYGVLNGAAQNIVYPDIPPLALFEGNKTIAAGSMNFRTDEISGNHQ